MKLEIRLSVQNKTKSFQYEAERILRTYHSVILRALFPGTKAAKSSKKNKALPIREGYDSVRGEYYFLKNWIQNNKKDRIIWLEN